MNVRADRDSSVRRTHRTDRGTHQQNAAAGEEGWCRVHHHAHIYPRRHQLRSLSMLVRLRLYSLSLAQRTAAPARFASSVAASQANSTALKAVQRVVKRRSPLCIAVVDAADFEGTCPPRKMLKSILGDEPVVLAVTKIDRMPRFDEYRLGFLEYQFARRIGKGRILGTHAVSAATGAGLPELAQRAIDHPGDVMVFGASRAGKSELVRA